MFHACGAVYLVVVAAMVSAMPCVLPGQQHGAGEAHGQAKPGNANRLSKETSPYLRQHQFNPVDWHAWGPEALQLAKKLDKPIFLSIGYSACHWCHVMAKESFSDPDIAKLMNEKFVSIKVDREERPDIDEIYMRALRAMDQRGGWPLSIWLTPDGKPFYGGTYFPPEDGGGRPGFARVCRSLAAAWKDRRAEVLEGANALSTHLAESLAPKLKPGDASVELLARIIPQAQQRFDPEHGGFTYPPRGAPKFPHSTELQVLLRLPEKQAVDMAVTTLHAMRRGGMNDQLGGGFHRYSTDRTWLVPHFEKMLYDNALLASCYLDAYQLTGEARFAATARATLDYMLRELQAPDGGFFASQDAQSEGVEGKFFVWQQEEIEGILGDQAALLGQVLGVSEQGNWEHKNVLWLADEAPILGAANATAATAFAAAKAKLLAVRERRIKPGTDDKVLVSWNGLTLMALCDGYRVLEDTRYLEAAKRTARFLLDHVVTDGRSKRSWQGGKARHQGYLEDYAALACGLVSLFEVDSDARWLAAARQILEQTVKHFRADDGAFWFTADDHEQLLARSKGAGEGATPSGTALAAQAFLRAGLLLGDERLYGFGVDALRAHHELLAQRPSSAASLMLAVQFHLGKPKEIVIAGEPDDVRTQALLRAAWQRFGKPGVVALVHKGNRTALTELSGVFAGKLPIEGVPAAYVCERGVCQAPITDPAELGGQ